MKGKIDIDIYAQKYIKEIYIYIYFCIGHVVRTSIYNCVLTFPFHVLFVLSKYFSWSWFCVLWGNLNLF